MHISQKLAQAREEGKPTFRGGRDRGKEYFTALHRYLLHYAQDAYEDLVETVIREPGLWRGE